MPIPPAKVLCIGVDAANPDLIRSWAADGSLPTFRTLFGRGVSGDLKGIEGFFVGSTWPSMYTGASPADHAFHYLVQLSPGTYGFHRPADHGIAKIPPFWSHLSRAGRRVAILDVPLTPLDPNLSGLQTVEWGGHDSVYGFLANPDSLTASIPSRFGRHPAGLTCDGQRRTSEEYEGFLQDLLNGVELKGRLTRHLLAEGDWDMFMQVFTESHCVGHQCWHLHDPTHPAHDPLVRKKVGDPLLRVYQAIDRALGEILEGSGDTFVLVFSAHSMSHWYGTQFLLRDILVRLGVAREPNGGRTDGPEHGWLQGTSPPMAGFRWVWRKLPDGVRRNLGPLRDRLREPKKKGTGLPTIDVDLSSSRCFPVPNGLSVGGIRLNLMGREPTGALDPVDADQFCEDLSNDLLAIREPGTDRALVKAVRRTSDLYSGRYLDHLPDLLVEWDDTVPVGSAGLGTGAGSVIRACSEKIGTVEGQNEYGRSGEHRPDGFFVAAGPRITQGRLERRVGLIDLAPTLCHRLGVALPGCTGARIPELLGP